MLYKRIYFSSDADWLAWRSSGIGASDVPSIMDEGFLTPYELWQEKMFKKTKAQTAAMADGKKHECSALQAFEAVVGPLEQQVALESIKYPFLRCTLDGFNGEIVVETKCMKGASNRISKIIPHKYYGQVQMQLFISRAKKAYYVEYDIITKEFWHVEVKPDKKYQKRMLAACTDFWHCVTTRKAPELTAKEQALADLGGQVHTTDLDWIKAEDEYESALRNYNRANSYLKVCKGKLEELSHGKCVSGSKFELRYTFAEAPLELDYIPELRGVDLDQYRKSPVRRVTICSKKIDHINLT